MKEYIAKVAEGENLTEEEAKGAMDIMLSGDATQAQIAAFLALERVKGETLDELAAALSIDAAGLKASVEQYNADAEAGAENAVLGKVPSRALDAEGPFYGVRVEAANHMTKGGVAANEKAQVLFEDGSVVNGLYAAGEVTSQTGGYSQSVVFGKVAGENAAAALK